MKCLVLIENTVPQGSNLEGEHGLSLLISYKDRTILLDAGSSGKFADNAQKLGADLSKVDFAVLSHGHFDHADGLRRFVQCNAAARVYARPSAGDSYFSTSTGAPRFIGVHRDIWEGCRERFDLSSGPRALGDGVWLLPETVHGGPFASRETNLLRKVGPDQFVPDDFSHEQSLVLEGEQGLVVFNSCSHGGIVNIVKGVKEQLHRPVYAVVGGLHMFSASAPSGMNCPGEYVGQVARALRDEGVQRVYTGHCTGPAAAQLLERELGGGLVLLNTGMTFTV